MKNVRKKQIRSFFCKSLCGTRTADKSVTLPWLPSWHYLATALILVAVAGCYTPQVTLNSDEKDMVQLCVEKSSEFCDISEVREWDELCLVIEQQYLVLDTLLTSESLRPSARLQTTKVYDVTRVNMMQCDDHDGSRVEFQETICETGHFLEKLLEWEGE